MKLEDQLFALCGLCTMVSADCECVVEAGGCKGHVQLSAIVSLLQPCPARPAGRQ